MLPRDEFLFCFNRSTRLLLFLAQGPSICLASLCTVYTVIIPKIVFSVTDFLPRTDTASCSSPIAAAISFTTSVLCALVILAVGKG